MLHALNLGCSVRNNETPPGAPVCARFSAPEDPPQRCFSLYLHPPDSREHLNEGPGYRTVSRHDFEFNVSASLYSDSSPPLGGKTRPRKGLGAT